LFVFLPHPIEKVVSLSRVNGHSLWLWPKWHFPNIAKMN
jgi:hypothetical protein